MGHHPTGDPAQVPGAWTDELKDLLQTHMAALSHQEPVTEKDIAGRLKSQVTELRNLSLRRTQLQANLDATKTQYQHLLQEMQDLQGKLNDGQKAMKLLSDDYMKAVNQAPPPAELSQAENMDNQAKTDPTKSAPAGGQCG